MKEKHRKMYKTPKNRTYVLENRNEKSHLRKMVLFLGTTLFCTGCGQAASADIPELIEPIAVNSAYRPVEYGTVGDIEILFGTVVPTDYCHYYSANVTVSRIVVEVGDQVQEGEILAYADVETAREELEACREQLAMENKSYELSSRISQARQDKLKYQKEALEAELLEKEEALPEDEIPEGGEISETGEIPEGKEASETGEILTGIATAEPEEKPPGNEALPGTEEAVVLLADYEVQAVMEQENARYDAQLHEYRIKKLEESIASMEKIIADGTLTARHSGQVTYTKNIAKGRAAGANENIVVISDLADTRLELTDTSVQDYKYADYEVKYLTIAGEKIAVTEEEYSVEELILAKVNHLFPNVRIQCPEGITLIIGDTYPVYYIKKEAEHVLIIGNDSLHQEDGEYYVYVSSDTKEKEKRIIKVGTSDANYTQVLEGLTEGELVYYDSDARMPANYTEYTVSLSDYELVNQGIKYGKSDANTFSSVSEWEGEVTRLAVSKGQEIAEGDLLYIIDTGEGKAAMTAARYAINQENNSYQRTIADYNEQIAIWNEQAAVDEGASYEVQILEYQKELAAVTHEGRLKQLQKEYDRICEGNDGTGKISVYAKTGGMIAAVELSEGDQVENGSEILRITTQSTDILLVQMKPDQNFKVYSDNIADVGERVSLTAGENTWEGTCIGWVAGETNTDKGYVYTDEQGAHLSYNTSSGYDYPAFYVRMDDASFLENIPWGSSFDFSYISMKDIIVLPSSMVYTETKPFNDKKVYYYVWRIEGEELVKQYVMTADSEIPGESRKKVILSGVQAGDVLAQE